MSGPFDFLLFTSLDWLASKLFHNEQMLFISSEKRETGFVVEKRNLMTVK